MSAELDAAIAKEEENARNLREELARSEARLKTLIEARRIMRGEPGAPAEKKSIPDLVEELLREKGGPMHINEIVSELRRHDLVVARGTVTTSIWRYVHKGTRFKKVGPNRFTLR